MKSGKVQMLFLKLQKLNLSNKKNKNCMNELAAVKL